MPRESNNELAALQLLRWYAEMGVDAAISETPADWFAQSKKPLSPRRTDDRQTPHRANLSAPSPAPKSGAGLRATPEMPMAPDAAIMASREKARSAATLDELRETLAGFDGCGLKATAKNMCFARGNADADVMFIGEAPGRDEDLQGLPFVGRAGHLLDKMLASIGLSEETAYVTNIVYWRPPGNRTPTPQESQVCLPFLERQVELVDPKIVVFLGGAAAKQMFNTTVGIMRLRGKWRTYSTSEKDYKAIATLHPAYLLRTPVAKRQVWRDLIQIKLALDTPADD
ncbi:MAG: uracil-DNA glycosylase [Methyloligellaceae bacterium]